jgi:condensin-2 complex subunit H2
VQQWEKRIAPKLEEENSRRPFDVHQYGSEILARFQRVNDQYTFDQLMGGEQRYERCRYFLSSLMMANTLNVEVADDHERVGMDAAVDQMRLKLLKRDRHHTQFDRE